MNAYVETIKQRNRQSLLVRLNVDKPSATLPALADETVPGRIQQSLAQHRRPTIDLPIRERILHVGLRLPVALAPSTPWLPMKSLQGCRRPEFRSWWRVLRTAPPQPLDQGINPAAVDSRPGIDELLADMIKALDNDEPQNCETSHDCFADLQRTVFRTDPSVRSCMARANVRQAAILPLSHGRRGPHVMSLEPSDPETNDYSMSLSALRSIGWIPFQSCHLGDWHILVGAAVPTAVGNARKHGGSVWRVWATVRSPQKSGSSTTGTPSLLKFAYDGASADSGAGTTPDRAPRAGRDRYRPYPPGGLPDRRRSAQPTWSDLGGERANRCQQAWHVSDDTLLVAAIIKRPVGQ